MDSGEIPGPDDLVGCFFVARDDQLINILEPNASALQAEANG